MYMRLKIIKLIFLIFNIYFEDTVINFYLNPFSLIGVLVYLIIIKNSIMEFLFTTFIYILRVKYVFIYYDDFYTTEL